MSALSTVEFCEDGSLQWTFRFPPQTQDIRPAPRAALVAKQPDGRFVVTCTFGSFDDGRAFQNAREVSQQGPDRRCLPKTSDVGHLYPVQLRHLSRSGRDHVVWDPELGIARFVTYNHVCQGCRKKMWGVEDGFPVGSFIRGTIGPRPGRCLACTPGDHQNPPL